MRIPKFESGKLLMIGEWYKERTIAKKSLRTIFTSGSAFQNLRE